MKTTGLNPESRIPNSLAWWVRGRSGTGGAVVFLLFVAYSSAELPAGSRDADLQARAVLGLTRLFIVGMVLSVVWAWEWATRRWGSAEAGATGAWWWARPRWCCSPRWVFTGAAAGGAIRLVWIPLGPSIDRMWRHGPPGTYNDLPNISTLTVWAAAISSVVCAPVLEELLFRGGIQSWLARRVPPVVAVTVATGLFTAAHGVGPGAYNSVQLLSVLLAGLVYAWLYQATGSVTPGIVAHMVSNGSILVSLAAGAPLMAPAIWAVVCGLVGVVLLRAPGGRAGRLGRVPR